MYSLEFIKMHGLGNDFVIIDSRKDAALESLLIPEKIAELAERRFGIGCDQVICITPPKHGDVSPGMRIFNADGSEAEACGNGTRCVAAFLGKGQVTIESQDRLLKAFVHDDETVTVDMGKPHFQWQDIPLSRPANTQALEINLAHLHPKGACIYNGTKPVAVNIGNPHLVFFVNDLKQAECDILGPLLENDSLFPEKINVGFVQVVRPDLLLLKVWERGTGITLACGTGACAALVAVHYGYFPQPHFPRKAMVRQQGGDLSIEWAMNGHVLMTGPTRVSFRGTIDINL